MANPCRLSSLSLYLIWHLAGRGFDLDTPKCRRSLPHHLCGRAEIDGKPVDVLPANDDTPSRLTRTVSFEIFGHQRPDGALKLPE